MKEKAVQPINLTRGKPKDSMDGYFACSLALQTFTLDSILRFWLVGFLAR